MRYFLDRVEMFTNGALYEKYQFSYGSVSGLKTQFLSTVDEIGSDGQTKRIATMSYKDGPVNNGTTLQFQSKATFPLSPFSFQQQQVLVGEVNGDGIPDLLRFSLYTSMVEYSLGTGMGGLVLFRLMFLHLLILALP